MKDWHFWAYFLQLCLHLRPLRVGSNCWKMAWPLWTPRGSCSKRRPCRSLNEKLVKWPIQMALVKSLLVSRKMATAVFLSLALSKLHKMQVQKSGPSCIYVALAGPKSAVGNFSQNEEQPIWNQLVCFITVLLKLMSTPPYLHYLGYHWYFGDPYSTQHIASLNCRNISFCRSRKDQ